MAIKKPADLTGLVATKGAAAPVAHMPPRTIHVQDNTDDDAANNVPLNFRVPAELRRRFRIFAATNDLKLNELLRLAFNEYEKRHSN